MVSDQPGSPDTDLVTPLLTNLTDDQRKIIVRYVKCPGSKHTSCGRPGSRTVRSFGVSAWTR